MRASLKLLTFGLLMLMPLSTAHAQGPSLSPIANMSVNAGSTLNVNVVAIDVDDRVITLTAALPPFATLNTPTIGTGVVVTTLSLAPTGAQVGDFTAAVTATAGGVSTVRVFQITVNAAGSDRAPVVVAPPLREVTAGSHLSFVVTASDADADAITSLSTSGLPPGATFTPNGSNTAGTFDWTPLAENVGEYDVLFTATNALSGTSVTHLRVTSAPTLTITPIDDVTVAGGGSASVPVHAAGVPGEEINLTAALPTFATLDPPGTGTGVVNTTVTISPPTGSAGTYHASITATSGTTSVTEPFDIIVTGSSGGDNHAPALTAPATATVAVASTLSFEVTATDPDGDHVDLFGTALPPGSTFVDHGNETGTFTWTPASAGTYTASFSGFDGRGGSGSASTSITVTGGNENHAPTVSAPSTAQVNEGVNLSFTVTAADQDGDPVALSGTSLPSGATFSDHGNNTGTFSWTPASGQAGPYTALFTGLDGRGGSGSASTSITVTAVNANHAPTLSAPATAQVNEGVNLSFAVTASDQDGDPVALSGTSLPSGAAFSDHGNNTGTFSWTPGSTQSGTYTVGFLGNDGHGGTGTAHTTITVMDVSGGGEVPGRACLIGNFKVHRDTTCFRIKPVEHSFDLRDVVLSSIRLRLHDQLLAALPGAAIELHCPPGHRKGGDNGDDGDDGDDDFDCDHGDHHDDGDDDGGGKCGVSCKDHCDNGNHNGDDHHRRDGDCDTLGIRACFSTDGLLQLFAPPKANKLPCALVDAEILATLRNGATIVARFNARDDDDHGEGDDDGDHKDKHHDPDLKAAVNPNPLNPSTALSFTMAHDSRVQVVVYDMQGRIVKKLLDEFRPAGPHTLAWDGTNEGNLRVASGVYFFRVWALEGSVTRRVVVVK